MFRLVLKPILLLTLTFAAFNLAARALGSTQPPNPALEGFTVGCEGKPQPCWYGIAPGMTTVRATNELLEDMGYKGSKGYRSVDYMDYHSEYRASDFISVYPFCERSDGKCQSGTIESLYIFGVNEIKVGDAFVLFGKPQYVDVSATQGLLIVFKEALVSATGWDSPNYSLIFMKIETQSDLIDIDYWHGFVPLWRYCQLEPTNWMCQK